MGHGSQRVQGGGYVWALTASPQFETDGTIFAGTDGAGIYRSTDRGDTWHGVSAGLGHRSIRALAVSPAFGTDATVFAGGPDGVYKSTDDGTTWKRTVDGPANMRVLSLAVSPGFAAYATYSQESATVCIGLPTAAAPGSGQRRV